MLTYSVSSTRAMFAGQVAGKLIGMNVVGGVVHIGEAPEHSGSNITGGASISTSGGVLIAMSTIASISPGLIDTGASRAWLDLTGAPQPDEVADPIVDFVLRTDVDESLYGELVHVGRDEPGLFGTATRTGSIVPWQ